MPSVIGIMRKASWRGTRSRSGGYPLRRVVAGIRCVALVCVLIALGAVDALARETQADRPPALRFFLDEAPPGSVLSELPPSARRAFIAKVRVVEIVRTGVLLRRPEEFCGGPPPVPPYALRAEVEITAPIAGATIWRRRLRVEFSPTRSSTRYVVPLPPEIGTSGYFIVSFIDENNIRTLHGLGASEDVYDAWHRRFYGPHAKQRH